MSWLDPFFSTTNESEATEHRAAARKLEHAFQVSLAESAREGELRICRVRALAFSAVALLDGVLALAHIRPFENLFGSVPIAGVSVLIFALLRKTTVTRSVHILAPVLDAGIVYWLLTRRAIGPDDFRAMASTTALVCALLAATGGLRLRVRAVFWSTFLASVLYWWFVVRVEDIKVAGQSGVTWAYGLVALSGVGLLSIWTVQLAKRAARFSQSRVVLQRFLPENLVSQAFERPDVDWFEPRSIDATIVFTDIRGFTTWSESLPPESVLQALSELQGLLARAVQAEGGFVDKFLGDGMLAVFGTNESSLEHADRAIRSIQRMRQALLQYNEEHDSSFRLGIAAHSGPVVLGCLGNVDRLEMTVIGDTVNTASRLEAETKRYDVDVLISGTTASRAGLGLPEVARFQPRGKATSVTVHALPTT